MSSTPPASSPAPAPAPARPAGAPEKPASWLRENLEAIVVAVILALLIRQYATEAFVIPTGSMAPTLLGAHVDLVCTNCGKPQPVSESILATSGSAHTARGNARGKCPKCGKVHAVTLREDEFTGGRAEVKCDRCGAQVPLARVQAPAGEGDKVVEATCENCGIRFQNRLSSGGFPFHEEWPSGPVSRGDRVLVDKFSYKFTDPRRFEVIVFKYPVRPSDNFIKRLIGLPGDLIDVKNGDIYANGTIARKPLDVQEQCWHPVYESRYVEKDPGGGPDGRKTAFRFEGGVFEPTPDRKGFALKKALGGGPAWIVYNRPIRDLNTYNADAHFGGEEVVGDTRAVFDVTLGGTGMAALARLSDQDDVLEAELDVGRAVVRRNGKEIATAPLAFASGLRHRVDFGRADARAVLSVDGKVVVACDFTPRDGGATERSEVRFGSKGGDAAVFHEASIYRDVYYLSTIRGAQPHLFPFRVPPGQYFAMGDNSSNSTDSRVWGTVPEGYLIGRAFLVFWPALPGDFAVRRIR
jgi:signal peptidase I